jgi:hypothetical protein
VLQDKSGWGGLSHLDGLAGVAVYGDYRQLHEVRCRWDADDDPSYTLRVWRR